MIPPFTEGGLLPPGVHDATWTDFVARFGGTARRKVLITGLRAALEALGAAGGTRVYVDGSFVSDAAEPGDWDACWEEDGVDLGILDPVVQDLRRGRAAQKLKFLGEMFPAHGIADEDGAYFADFFQWTRDGTPKGVVILDVRGLS